MRNGEPVESATWAHASRTADGRYLITGRGEVPAVNVADLRARRSWTLALGNDVDFVGGVALNRGWINRGLLAVHSRDKVIVTMFDPAGPLVERGRVAIERSRPHCGYRPGRGRVRGRPKAAGVVIFTIGLGDDLGFGALEQIASTPGYFEIAPDAEELAGIYTSIAGEIPCPANAFWGGRP